MKELAETRTRKRCAVYCRVSTDERLNQEFNSIDAQKEAGQAYIVSQRAEGWIPVADDYDDGGFSGGNMERPALKRLMTDISKGLALGANAYMTKPFSTRELVQKVAEMLGGAA